jgi:hypothetical protein
MFADLDEAIRRMLVERGGLNSGEIDIAFDMPTREWAAGISKPTVNLYLYDLRENMQLKDPAPWKVKRGPNNTAIKTRPDVQVDISYNITAFASTVEDEHRLLGRVLVTLLQHPVLPEDILQGAIVGQEIRTFAARPSSIIQGPADYWGALDNDIRPSIDYRLTVRVDLSQETSVGLALTSQLKVGQIDRRNGSAEHEELPLRFGGRVSQGDNAETGIPGVKVTLLERALDTVTDAEGRYSFSVVPAGQYTLVISAPGMDERRQQIEIPGGSYDVWL